nr:ATP-binding protein [Pseudomonadota bacterium]
MRDQFTVLAAKSAFQQGHLSNAVALISRRFAGADLTRTTLNAREGHEAAYAIFKKAGDQPKALAHLEALKRLDDKTSTLAASANTALAAARFDFANQELKIAKLQRDDAKRTVEFERARARTQQFIFLGAGGVAIVVVSMLAFGLVTIRRSRNEVRAANVDLETTNSALAKALAAKTEFLATTSHEIRTPLNGILGMTQVMLADPSLAAAMRERIDIVHGAGVSMRALVDDILDVAKMETGNMTIECAPFDLRATLTDLCRMWQEQAKGRGIAFTLDLADCPSHIEGDVARLRQVAFNLLSNALKFTEAGSVLLRATTRDTTAGEELVIAVSDTGIGIPADKQELVFESFRQADGGTTRKFGGTGLGLSICRNLARAMGGDVTLASEDGHGATFTLALPLVRCDAPDSSMAGDADGGSALLIVDLNPISRAMLKAVLAQRAGTVLFASGAKEAVTLIEAGGIATVLIDDATIRAAEDADTAISAIVESSRAGGAVTGLLWAGLDAAQLL